MKRLLSWFVLLLLVTVRSFPEAAAANPECEGVLVAGAGAKTITSKKGTPVSATLTLDDKNGNLIQIYMNMDEEVAATCTTGGGSFSIEGCDEFNYTINSTAIQFSSKTEGKFPAVDIDSANGPHQAVMNIDRTGVHIRGPMADNNVTKLKDCWKSGPEIKVTNFVASDDDCVLQLEVKPGITIKAEINGTSCDAITSPPDPQSSPAPGPVPTVPYTGTGTPPTVPPPAPTDPYTGTGPPPPAPTEKPTDVPPVPVPTAKYTGAGEPSSGTTTNPATTDTSAPAATTTPESDNTTVIIIICVVVGVIILLIIVGIIVYCFCFRKKKDGEEDAEAGEGAEPEAEAGAGTDAEAEGTQKSDAKEPEAAEVPEAENTQGDSEKKASEKKGSDGTQSEGADNTQNE